MTWSQYKIQIDDPGRGVYEITQRINDKVKQSGVVQGLAHVYIHHTSASLIISENADPAVHTDLESFMQRTAPDGDPLYTHTQEGPDDMSAHVRCVLTQTELTIPITDARLALGVWQGVYLWEHRHRPHERTITLTMQGTNSP